MQTLNIHPAKQLPRLVDKAAAGEEIAGAGKPVARLVPSRAPQTTRPRVLGRLTGEFKIPLDFDAPLPSDVVEAFEGG